MTLPHKIFSVFTSPQQVTTSAMPTLNPTLTRSDATHTITRLTSFPFTNIASSALFKHSMSVTLSVSLLPQTPKPTNVLIFQGSISATGSYTAGSSTIMPIPEPTAQIFPIIYDLKTDLLVSSIKQRDPLNPTQQQLSSCSSQHKLDLFLNELQ
jgi:hypothetical protein